ncbi:unnamed protein product [Paramecium pentaurelia]|uniref:RBR-type E3 ubiquitin transferase n=1 Tax=Paramecium pentaurelia TaxID=43138 RepID=A0A8S1TPJ9_9CILI|nr:unnamed protein product [Paramecium pentaurelia]
MGQICMRNCCNERGPDEDFCIMLPNIFSSNSQIKSIQQEEGRKIILLMQSNLYEEIQSKLENEQNNTQESQQIVLNIFLYFNFKEEDVKRCFNLLKTNDDYKENLKLIGIYRESSLKYYKKQLCSLCHLENMECYSLRCQHIFCKDCWNLMIEIQLSNFIPIVKCLEYQCLERLPHQFLEQYQLYKEILVKRMLDNDKNYTWCPGLNCQNLYKQQGIQQKVKCHCGEQFCPYCKVESHYPISCEIFKEITQFKESNQSWTTLDISICPNCNRNIQKIEGCLQISCVCGNNFCNKCQQAWNKEHGQNYFNCSYASYNKNPSQILNQLRQRESTITKEIFQLQNYQQQFNQKQYDYYTRQFQMGLHNLIKFKKFEKIVQYFTYYLNEKFNDDQLDHYCDKYSLEINNYQRILLNQLQGVIINDAEMINNEKIGFIDFVNLISQMDQNLKIQKHCFKKYIIDIQLEKQQQLQ